MKKNEIRVCVMRVPGTNRDYDLTEVFDSMSVRAEIARMNEFSSGAKKLSEYHLLVFPGGFAYGDWIRSGAIWAKKLMTVLARDVKEFVREGKLVMGICNGMQVVIETGLVPALKGVSLYPEAAMATNASAHFECRWVFLRKQSEKNLFVQGVDSLVSSPVCHGEGKFTLPTGQEKRILKELEDNQQIVFRYCNRDGSAAKGAYPANPNGSFDDVAGVSNPEGNVVGWMPHLENACFEWQLPDWTRKNDDDNGLPARKVFENAVSYLEKKL